MQTYLQQLKQVLEHGTQCDDRTGVGTLAYFGLHARYNLQAGFPAVTTKKLAWKVMASELLWFISGSNNIEDLKRIYPQNKIWDANYADYLVRLGLTENDGDMGRVYGVQWRAWQTPSGQVVDQLADAIHLIRHNPTSRRIIVNAWNPAEISADAVALPPCHNFFQFFVAGNTLSLQMYQRSADMFLGVPFNIASYALLLHLVAKITGLVPGEFIHTIGNAHIYLDAVEQVKAQLQRAPLPTPTLMIKDRGQTGIDDFELADLTLEHYQSHAAIKAKMAV